MSQPSQPSLPQRQFSPPQHSPSPVNSTAAFNAPAAKRLKVEPGTPSQPGSPYLNSPYPNTASPSATTPSATSPIPPHIGANNQLPQNNYIPSHQPNGRPQTSLTMPSAPPISGVPSSQPPTPTTAHTPAPYSNATLAPVNTTSTAAAIGNMGPPSINPSSFSGANDAGRSFSKSTPSSKVASYEVNDMLMGTGIDLEEEQELSNNLMMETRTGFGYHPPGGRDSFYGAGPANQPAQQTEAKSQEELAVEGADYAWNAAARQLAITRSLEMREHLLEPGLCHKRMQEVAYKYGLALNLELKPDGKSLYIGKFVQPHDFPKPEIRVSQRPGPDGMMVDTHGSFIPKEAYLIDQIALLSIGTKERLRDMLSDANKVASTRQKNAHGIIPTEWAEAATYSPLKTNGAHGDGQQVGADSAASPRTTPLKRSADEISNGLPTPVSDAPPPNIAVEALVSAGKGTRNCEEGRLKKRAKRQEKATEKDKEGADGGSRGGSAVPGTPGSVAPELNETKAPTKKEGKKAAAKAAEASSTSVNATLGLFAGGKKKKYSWMTSGGPGSGASTPRASVAPGTPGGGAASSRAIQGPRTAAGVSHLGQFREDSEKGKNIQLRDWIMVLEDRGYDLQTLQDAYGRVDRSDAGDKVATGKS
ncbi:hypothetical protein F5Y15DRAFT_179733 [Xylariaceae sp. FL0016]|nr:hypothetical protein F5Y15DRAFT_179733 [Xylariaceae sp. FL0016]